jgi:hypothetical protein
VLEWRDRLVCSSVRPARGRHGGDGRAAITLTHARTRQPANQP